MKKKINKNYKIIENQVDLANIIKSFEGEKNIAFDLEADSMFHFKEKVCLLQMAANEINILIDPLKNKDLSLLKPLFLNRDIKKIFHGADYDVRSLYRDFSIEINNLFDTEIACRFLGFKETGLGTVLQKRFDVSLDKKYQKKNWSQRPLPDSMIEYAAKDTIYLAPLASILEKELEKKGRLDWVLEECENLSKVRHVLWNGEPLFLRFKGAGRLMPKSLAVLETLLQFRMEIAEKKDRPLFKIFGNDSLMKLAVAKPVTLRSLKALNALSPKQISMYAEALTDRICNALKIPEDKLPRYPRKRMPVLGSGVSKRIKRLKVWRDSMAQQLEIDPGIVCNKALMSAIAVENPSDTGKLEAIKEMKNWQKKEFGKDVVDFLKKEN